jgi:hypothetical protein
MRSATGDDYHLELGQNLSNQCWRERPLSGGELNAFYDRLASKADTLPIPKAIVQAKQILDI